MPVNAADLTPEARRRLGIGSGGGKGTRRNTHKGERDAAPCPGRCTTDGCDEPFDTYTAWERHADRTGHRRWEAALDGG